MTKRTRAPRRRVATHGQTIDAVLTGGPLPDPVSTWDAYRIEHPDNCGLIGLPGHDSSLASIWHEYHGRDLTADDRAYLAGRAAEIRARQSMASTCRQVDAQTPEASNWPDAASSGFRPIATTEIPDDDDA